MSTDKKPDDIPEELPPIAESDPPAAPALTPEEAEQAQAELSALRDRYVRLQADFDNYRKRVLRERAEAQASAHEELVRTLLPVLDNFDLGLASAAEHGATESFLSGFKLVHGDLLRVLERAGMTPVDATAGTPFDPHQHEAIAHAPSQEYAADTVLQQTRRGYRLGAQLIRPAQVVVSSGAPEGESDGER